MKGGPRFLAVLYIMRTIPKATPQQLEKMRSLPNYRFRLFDESFPQYHDGDAKMFLTYGRQMLYSSPELSEDRLLLAKLEAGSKTAALYVDRDYYEVSLWDEDGHHHLDGWQWAVEFDGHSIEDLEDYMAQLLILES